MTGFSKICRRSVALTTRPFTPLPPLAGRRGLGPSLSPLKGGEGLVSAGIILVERDASRAIKFSSPDSLALMGEGLGGGGAAGLAGDRVGRRRFPRSTVRRGTQNRQDSGRAAPGDGTRIPSFDAGAGFARAASVMFRGKMRVRPPAPQTRCFFISRRARREASPPPNPPPSRGRAPRSVISTIN